MLENRKTRALVDVKFHRLNKKDLRHFGISKKSGWIFDWRKSFRVNCQVYAIFTLSNQNVVQGLISLKQIDPTDNYVEIQNVDFYVKLGALQIVNGVVYFNTSAALNLITQCQLERRCIYV